jgi:hypothetical protein
MNPEDLDRGPGKTGGSSMKATLAVLLGLCAAILSAAPALAHHSFAAEYDASKSITLRGTITKVEFTNPHGWIYLNVKDDQGSVQNWAIETGAPIQLIRRGGDKKSLAVGTEIVVDGWLARNGSRTVNGRGLKFSDGREILAGSSNTAQ